MRRLTPALSSLSTGSTDKTNFLDVLPVWWQLTSVAEWGGGAKTWPFWSSMDTLMDFPCGSVVKNLPTVHETQKMWVGSLDWDDPLEEEMTTTPVFLPGKSQGQRSLAGYSHGIAKSWTWLTDWAHTHRDTNRQVFLQSSFPGGQGFVGCVEQLDFFLCPVLLPPHSLIPSKHLTLYLSLFKVCFWRTSPVAASLSVWSSCLSFPHLLKQWSENLWFYSSCLAAVMSHSLWPHGL